jgi:ABC-type sugar transport system substrate-binding protein
VEVVFAEGNPVVQIHQLFGFIHARDDSRPRAIVVEATTGEGLERVARNAVKAGIGWILVNTDVGYLEGLRHHHPELPICAIGGDSREAGRIQGRQVRRLLPRGGSVLGIQGPSDSTVKMGRAEGFVEALGAGYQLKVVNGDWTEQGGARAMASWLRLKTVEHFRPDIVVCQNDMMAIGARRVLEEQRRDWAAAPFLGCDGLAEGGRRQVETGQLAATVVIPSNTGPALELVAAWFQDRKPLSAEILLAPSSFPPEDHLVPRPSAGEAGGTAIPSP